MSAAAGEMRSGWGYDARTAIPAPKWSPTPPGERRRAYRPLAGPRNVLWLAR